MQPSSENPHGNSDETMSNNQVEDLDTDENPDSFLDGSVMEKILQRRSLRMRNMQRAWLVRKYSPGAPRRWMYRENRLATLYLPSGLNEVSAGPVASCDQNDLMWVQPGDINGLKGQLVKLLELSGGCLSLTRVHAEYQKIFGRPLYISEYGAVKLVNLLKKVTPWFW
ncbi:unnamed protein product [Ilex paraguariensis]|uniref:HTH OST-type domain-containing protein n=1 Tax=Ilex paraguariensis TaxID=185542 RepID=A0ABC8SIB6_9AQUA